MNQSRKALIAALVVNAAVVAMEVFALAHGISQRGVGAFVFYTALSNLFGAIACVICLVGEIRLLLSDEPLPRWMRLVKYCAACTLTMTFFVVVLILAPAYVQVGQNGYYLMFCTGVLPITHLLGPLLVFFSFALFEAQPDLARMTFKESFIGFLPTLAYAAVAYPCNIALIWEGPYPFFLVWNMPIWQSVLWFFVLCALAIGLCQLPRLAARIAAPRAARDQATPKQDGLED